MKTILALVVLMGLSGFATAQENYSGVWQIGTFAFATVNQNGNSLVIVTLDPNELDYSAHTGSLQGNTAILGTVLGNAAMQVRTIFLSATSATMTILSCVPNPGYVCTFPPGITLGAVRIF